MEQDHSRPRQLGRPVRCLSYSIALTFLLMRTVRLALQETRTEPKLAAEGSSAEAHSPQPDAVGGPNRKAALFTLSERLPSHRPDELEILLTEVEQALATTEGSADG